MKIKVRIYGEISKIYGKEQTVELSGETTVLKLVNLIQKRGGTTRRMYLGEHRVGSADLAIIVNGRNIAVLDGLNTALADEDVVVITPFVTGG